MTTHAFDDEYWSRLWKGDGTGESPTMAAAAPNPYLIRELDDLEPGSALDAGCGAGAEAIWLAARGWQVTGVDIAGPALARAAERATAAGVADQVQWVQADLARWEPDAPFDLVTTHYAHTAMPQLEFYDLISSWVSQGGTLLLVGHLHRGGDPRHQHSHRADDPPAEASVTIADVTERLDPTAWEVVTAEESHRTMSGPGHGPVALHDVVVRAIRR